MNFQVIEALLPASNSEEKNNEESNNNMTSADPKEFYPVPSGSNQKVHESEELCLSTETSKEDVNLEEELCEDRAEADRESDSDTDSDTDEDMITDGEENEDDSYKVVEDIRSMKRKGIIYSTFILFMTINITIHLFFQASLFLTSKHPYQSSSTTVSLIAEPATSTGSFSRRTWRGCWRDKVSFQQAA